MIVGLFFAFLIGTMTTALVSVFQVEGDKIRAALSGESRPDPVVRPVSVRWEKASPRRPAPHPSPLAAAA